MRRKFISPNGTPPVGDVLQLSSVKGSVESSVFFLSFCLTDYQRVSCCFNCHSMCRCRVPCLLEVASPPGNSIVLLRDIRSCVGSEIWRGMTVTHSEPEWCFVHELLCKSQFAHKKTPCSSIRDFIICRSRSRLMINFSVMIRFGSVLSGNVGNERKS